MRCVSPSEVDKLFGKDGFSINANLQLQRFGLALTPDLSGKQHRVQGRPPTVSRLTDFAGVLNRWLPTKRHRLLWLSHWDNGSPNACEIFIAARIGLGESKSLLEAPGHYFDAHDYDFQDQVEMPRKQWRDVGVLAGLLALVMVNGGDAWLIAEGCTDGIEFWEGNLFLYSQNKARLADADTLMNNFECPRTLE